MSNKYTFKTDLDGLNEEIDKIIDGTLSEHPFKGQGQKQRIYELVCEYVARNKKLVIERICSDENEDDRDL